MSTGLFSLRRATRADIPTLVAIFEAAFRTDRHTRVKALDGNPQALGNGMRDALLSWSDAPTRCAVLVATEDASGTILGWACWSRHGCADTLTPAPARQHATAPVVEAPRLASLVTLEALTDRDRERWQAHLMPANTRCRILVTIAVSPPYQARGIGSALIRWGTRRADRDGVFCWVHASEAGTLAFERQGFAEIGRLTVDLNVYAPTPPPPADETRQWGRYTFRYMKRLPVS